MSDSSVTKKNMSDTIKELAKEYPFEKITVSLICEKCGMSRKSFYYHFKDKYDLVNWIFETDISEFVSCQESVYQVDSLRCFSQFFYQNRAFYKNIFSYVGQNSFENYLKQKISDNLILSFQSFRENEESKLYAEVLSDVICFFLIKWISSPDCETPEEFIGKTRECMKMFQEKIPRFLESF